MVPRIKEIPSKLEIDMLGNAEVLADTHIPVVNARLFQPITRCISVDTERRLREALGVNSLEHCGEVCVYIAALGSVRALEEGAKHSSNIARGPAIREPGLEGGDPCSLPAADQQIGGAVHARRDLLSSAKWQFVDVAGHEPLVYVEVRGTIVQLRMVGVHESLESGAGGAYAGGCRLVILAVGPGVHRCRCQVMGTVFELHVYAVVVRIAVPIAVDIDVDKVGVGSPAGIAAWGNTEIYIC